MQMRCGHSADARLRFQPLLTAGNVFAYAMSVYLYASSFRRGPGKRGKVLAAGGDTGNVVYAFFIGRELNPRCVETPLCVCVVPTLHMYGVLTAPDDVQDWQPGPEAVLRAHAGAHRLVAAGPVLRLEVRAPAAYETQLNTAPICYYVTLMPP